MEDWVLLVIVIIIIYLFATGAHRKIYNMCSGAMQQPAPSAAAPIAATAPASEAGDTSKEAATTAMEQKMLTEGIEGSDSCMSFGIGCHSCQGDFPFTTSDFGAPGMGFSDWAITQTLDPRIIASNQQFVADRLGNPQTWTGATYSPDRHDTWDAVPWRGLSRPARVAVNSPDQVPDLDTGRYPIVKRFRWDSSETE